MIKVFTKYDTIIGTICIPYIRKLTKSELNPFTNIRGTYDQTGFMTQRELHIKKIVYGLEGVKFVHYY